jgi:tetratricopeptide (TPR) repeat protein/SAM-dependent methyltransferase
MNRRERRAAQKQGRGAEFGAPFGTSPDFPTQLFATALRHLQSGQMAEAERSCRDLLAIAPDHFDGLHLLGIIAHNTGHDDDAAQLIGRALAVNERSPEAHFNLAQVLRARGRLDEAATHFHRCIELKPDYAAAHANFGHVLAQQGRLAEAAECFRQCLRLDGRSADAHYGLGNLLMQRGELRQAAEHYRQVVASKPNHAEAWNNLGITLARQGRFDAATQHYRQALALRPDLVDIYRNLARALLVQGDAAQALDVVRRGLRVAETPEAKAVFVQCARGVPSPPDNDDFCGLLARALIEGWSRPGELSAVAAELCKRANAALVECALQAWPRRLSAEELWPSGQAAVLGRSALLAALLASAPVRDIAFERFLTSARAALLAATAASEPSSITDDALRFRCALAQQCFVNEYVFAVSDPEREQVVRLQAAIEAALASGGAIPVEWLVAVAGYIPLHALAGAAALLNRTWLEPVTRLLDRQVREPIEELELRHAIPALTVIEDDVSLKVQSQYEDMPYPRWITPALPVAPVGIDLYLRQRFPLAPFTEIGGRERLDVLVAGCGTGQHAIETARRFVGAHVLAIDLSRASLGYAARKTKALGLTNIDYAQADILKLGAIGRSFDVIEASGVLHHMADPAQGWRVLLSLLRPGGFMHVGLYSALARRDVLAARQFIAERGYGQTADDIRQCRQELMACADGTPLKNVCKFSDFFTVSECRDLLFHVQEHQLTIPQIKAFLAENGLTSIGFATEAEHAYRQRFPAADELHDENLRDLDKWHLFETENPLQFVNMYQFWVQKPVAR